MANKEPLLEVRNLTTEYITDQGVIRAVDGACLAVNRGEAVGVAGESGCGKSTLALSILRVLPSNGRIVSGEILFERRNLLDLSEEEMQRVRWKEISIVLQGAMNALNPVKRVGEQVVEPLLIHGMVDSLEEALERGKELFSMVGIDPSRLKDYPHEFSGGMKQRAMIAMALACNPKLVIADEPTTALDVMVQAQILDLLEELQKKLALSLILITHNLSVIAEACDRVYIMYAGKIVEFGSVEDIFEKPLHPYTEGLLGCFPNIASGERRLHYIPGVPPALLSPPGGCRFHPRCPYAKEICKRVEPPLIEVERGRFVACHLQGEGRVYSLASAASKR